MTDDRPDLTPDETDRVRRLLAEARHTDPVPADVAARLDRTLATLAEERREREAHPVVSLASRRRRRATQLLVAAAAVVVVGVGANQLVSGLDASGGDAASTSDSAGAEAGGGPDQPGASPPGAEEEPPEAAGGATAGPLEPDAAAVGPVIVRDATFDADVLAARARAKPGRGAPQGFDAAKACDDPDWAAGDRVPVRYDDAPAVLVFLAPVDGTQTVNLYTCDSATPVRSSSVTAP